MSHTRVFERRAQSNRKGGTDEEQSQEHAHHFHSHQGDCPQKFHFGSPKSQFHILL
jgi:hypothetical protein